MNLETLSTHHPHWPLKARLLISALKNIKAGEFELRTPEGQVLSFKGSQPGPKGVLVINNWSVIAEIFRKGDIGVAESYMRKDLELPDISSFIHWACLNEDLLLEQFHGSWVGTIYYKFKHLFNRNTESRARKNIQAHYDLGNSFYKLWLDQTMTYSSAIFCDSKMSLEEAQRNKYETILARLNLKPNDTILEIGCGWGGFITSAVEKGANVVALTISDEQFEYCAELIRKHGWSDRVTLLKQDYRLHKGLYDHVVSIEMIEAVGYEYWPTYFSKIEECLKPNGSAIIQGISIKDEQFDDYRAGTDFIQQYIFPGGMLLGDRSASAVWESAGLHLKEKSKFGLSYAETLRLWAESFNEKLDEVKTLGFDEKFIRMWNFYLGYCEGAFRAGRVDVGHYELIKSKELNRG